MLDGSCTPGERAVAVFSPAAVAVHREPSALALSSPRTALPVVVTAVEPRGPLVRVRAADLAADVTAASAADLDLVPGARVWFAVKAAEVAVHAARRPRPPGAGAQPPEAQASSTGR